jgi:uncharacterized protein YlxW (UPF0749 family)
LRGLKEPRRLTAPINSTKQARQSCKCCTTAGVAEENSRHALETAQKLSHQLQSAENRVAELEAEVAAYQERAERAEQWLHRVYTEIEERFLQQTEASRAVSGAPQRPQRANRR